MKRFDSISFWIIASFSFVLPMMAPAQDAPPPVFVAPTPAAAPPNSTPAAAATSAAPAAPPSAPAQRSAAELEKLVMPIALHPDPLIAIILPASVYPLEIVQAARFVKDTNNIPKVDEQPWDENVKAVAKFPDLVAKMDADLPWTMDLGQAFIDQPKELMDTIQDLRNKAQKAGTLRSSEQQIVTVTNVVIVETNLTQIVTVTNTIVQVAPSNPQVVYVPSYPPTVYYPPPAYVYNPYAPLVTFGVGIAVGAIIANNCDWHGGCVWHGGGGDVDIDINNNVNIDRGDRTRVSGGDRAGTTGARGTQQKWQPDQNRMRNSGAAPTAQARDARGWGGGGTQPTQRASAGGAGGGARPTQSPSAGGGGARPSAQPSAPRPSPSTANRPTPSSAGTRPSPSPSSANRSSGSSSAFGGVSSGAGARNSSSRGAASRGGGGGGRGGGGGGRGGGGRR